MRNCAIRKTMVWFLQVMISAAIAAGDIFSSDFIKGNPAGWIESREGGKWCQAATKKITSGGDYAIYVEGPEQNLYLIRPDLNLYIGNFKEVYIEVYFCVEGMFPAEYVALSLRQGEKTSFSAMYCFTTSDQWIRWRVPLSSFNNNQNKSPNPTKPFTRIQLQAKKSSAAGQNDQLRLLVSEVRIYRDTHAGNTINNREKIREIISRWREFSVIKPDRDYSQPLLAGEQESGKCFLLDKRAVISCSAETEAVADSLNRELVKMFGEPLAIEKEEEEKVELPAIIIRHSGMKPDLTVSESVVKLNDEGYLLEIRPEGILIAGKNVSALRNGIYSFLEGLGMRWFMPGEIGECVPRHPLPLPVRTVKKAVNPAFEVRFPWYIWWWVKSYVSDDDNKRFAEWSERNKTQNHTTQNNQPYQAHHSFFMMLPEKEYGMNHPEYYALIDGKRVTDKDNGQICTTNPEVQEIVADRIRNIFRANPRLKGASLSPNDNPRSCECEGCRKYLDQKRLITVKTFAYGHLDGADLYINFMNQIRGLIKDEFPDKYLCTLVNYHNISCPPVRTKPDPHLGFVFTTRSCCVLHALDDPGCPVNREIREVFNSWAACGNPIYLRDYDPFIYEAGLPSYTPRLAARYLKFVAGKHALGFDTESSRAWASHIPDLYVRACLAWNPELDTDKLLDDFYLNFFGPAALEMKNYLEFFQYLLQNSPYHPIGGPGVMHTIYSQLFLPESLTIMEKYLQAAAKCPEDSVYARRVQMMQMEFEYFKLFLAMLNELNSDTPDKGYAIITEIEKLIEKMTTVNRDYILETVVLNDLRNYYLKLFQEKETHRRGKEVISLSARWRFKLDPDDLGIKEKWHETDTGAEWAYISIGNTWENQGYDYDGIAWYKTAVKIPENLKGKRIFMFVGALDESGEFFINGKEAYQRKFINPGDWQEPFEFEITKEIKFGTANTIVVRIVDRGGAGGLWKDVFLYNK